ncbi:glutamate 5-kinase [Geobacter sp. OR-1]|uniref:glutamate 5-kinase n=1 Tax=Geobacter sp. OR-1 TaxID=1266765 RepID=UPI0005428C18|nr:glutamate 5-kinase [Geobacter sp. OR-1]GAM10487.1 glutamate 5-kinase [Geobacter sp. OR-1]
MRRELLKNVRRVVVKIGSRVLTTADNDLDRKRIAALAAEIDFLRRNGIEVIVVSSGAVAAGRSLLGNDRPRTIPQKQAAAAVGQPRLMNAYEQALAHFGINTAQMLLTREDLSDRQRFLNARATIDTLLSCDVVPIINENDTVVVEEIKFGDNDNLSALVTNLSESNLLVILTDIDGFYDSDPRSNPDARLVPLVKGISKEIELAAGGSGSSVGTGGMATKIAAAKKAGRYGIPTIVANGGRDGILERLMAGEELGTLFMPAAVSLNRRKHWIAYTLRPRGRIIVDAGAAKVLRQHGKSLLPSGIVAVDGEFDRGACVRICSRDGNEIGRGLTDYSSRECLLIKGHQSSELEDILGYRYGDEVIHRDNLVILV